MSALRRRHFTIYVSSAGRVFARSTRTDGPGPGLTGVKDVDPGGNAFRFQGNSLVGTILLVSGASQMTISFDGAFQSCSVNAMAGRKSGHALKFKGVDGVTYEALGPPTISGQTCSITAGNLLAN